MDTFATIARQRATTALHAYRLTCRVRAKPIATDAYPPVRGQADNQAVGVITSGDTRARRHDLPVIHRDRARNPIGGCLRHVLCFTPFDRARRGQAGAPIGRA
jgi:hypothetical protein